MTACATTPTALSPPRFPSPEALQQLAAQPLPLPADAAPTEPVDDWKLSGPLPDVGASPAAPGGGPVGRLLSQAAASRGATSALASAAAACAARELGLFRAARAGAPPEALVRFVAGRCGLLGADPLAACQSVPAPADSDDSQVLEQNSVRLQAALGDTLARLPGGELELGLWVGRAAPDAALVCWIGAPRVSLAAPVALVPDRDGLVIIDSTLPAGTVRVDALITSGRLGTRACTVRPPMALPRAVVACAADRTDTAAWIDVVAYGPRAINGQKVLSALVWPAGVPGDTYRRAGANAAARPPITCARAGAAPPDDGVAACLNQLRRLLGMPPLKMAAGQSRASQSLAAQLFAARRAGTASPIVEQATLGLRAGWGVKADLAEAVGFGQVALGTVDGAADPAALLAALLERPSERATLLDPEAGALAVAVVAVAPGTTGAALASYRLVSDGRAVQEADVGTVLARVNALRFAARQSPVVLFDKAQYGTMTCAAHVTEGTWTPNRALDAAAQGAVQLIRWSHVHGWVVGGESLSDVSLPAPLFQLVDLELAVGVAHQHDPREPWIRYQVFLVVLHSGKEKLGPDSGLVVTPVVTNAGLF